MAIQTWMARQDRDGLQRSPAFVVPADKTEVHVVLSEIGFINEAQDIDLRLRASYNNRQSYEDFGSVNFRGGTLLGPNGQPAARSLGINLNSENYPTHLQVELTISGSVNCGVDVEFT